jgi:hypothetical protein
MDKSNLFRTKPKRDKAIDTTLDIVDTSLKVLDGAVDFLPGVGAVVNVLQLIVKQLRVSVVQSPFVLEFDTVCIENTLEQQNG